MFYSNSSIQVNPRCYKCGVTSYYLKAGLSGIVRQHGFVTVQDFYTAFYTTQRATDTYQKECAKWEEAYREKTTPKAETLQEKIQQYQEKDERQNNGRSINCTKEGGAR